MLATRRALLLAGVSAALARAQDRLTAGVVIDRIKANVGIPWSEKTVDTIIAGLPETAVQGIATTMMATLDVLQRAAKAGKNLVITHEPTFYSHQDNLDGLSDDETYRFKTDFIKRNDMVVFHFHDHWHRRRPDGIAVGMARELDWEEYADPEDPRRFELPRTSLADIAKHIESTLGAATLRVLGNPDLPIQHARASWGYVSQTPGIPFFAGPDVDLLIVGETREWELVEYAQDAIASGKHKALILIGHVASEQAGMKYCAEWLRTFISEAPIDFVPAGEPFWYPGRGA